MCKDKHVVWAVRVCTELQRPGRVVSPTEHAAHRGPLGTHTPNALVLLRQVVCFCIELCLLIPSVYSPTLQAFREFMNEAWWAVPVFKLLLG